MSEEPIPDDEMIRDLRARIAATPHDLDLRFALGVAFYRRGDIREAIPELQLAQQDAAQRIDAIRLLANAFEAIGMHDLAASRRLLLGALSEAKNAGTHTSPTRKHG